MKIKQQQSTFRETEISSKSQQIPISSRLSMVVTDSFENEKPALKDNESHQFDKWPESRKEKDDDDDEKEKEEKRKIETFLPDKGHKMNENYSQYAVCRSKDDDDKSRSTDCKHRARLQVALLGLAIAVVNCYAQATFCIAIVEMVLPSDFNIRSESSQLGMIDTAKTQNLTHLLGGPPIGSIGHQAGTVSKSIGNNDLSCPIEYKYKDYYDSWRFPATGGAQVVSSSNFSVNAFNVIENNVVDFSDRFDWDASRQGLLLGAFAVGTAPLQILGGRLAEIYGAKWVLLVGCIGTAITNLTIPPLAHYSFVLLIINRVVMGISQAGMEPGLMCLMANWLVPSETGFFISMLLFAICIGFFLGSLCSSFLLTLGYGWPITYYVAGGMNLVVGILWFLLASSRPRDSKFLSREEVEFIEREQQVAKEKKYTNSNNASNEAQWKENISTTVISNRNHGLSTEKKAKIYTEKEIGHLSKIEIETEDEAATCQAPWMKILSSKAVWAFIICKVSIRWSADVVSIELPTYLANVLHLSIKLNGIVNSISSALFAIFSFITGYFVNEIVKSRYVRSGDEEGSLQIDYEEEMLSASKSRRGISKTNLRKLVQSIGSFGSAIAVFMMTQYDCNILFSMSMLFVLSCSLVMGTGGELQIPYDMTSRYPGTLHGLACTLSVSGWLAPPLIGLILGERPSSRYRWSLVWYMTALINFIGGLVFVLFADASPCDFDRADEQKETKKEKEKEKTRREKEKPGSGKKYAHQHQGGFDKHNEMVRVHEVFAGDMADRCNGQTLASYYNLAQDNSPPSSQLNCSEQNSLEHAEQEESGRSLQASTDFHVQQQQQQCAPPLSSSMVSYSLHARTLNIPQELHLRSSSSSNTHEFDPNELLRNKEALRTKESRCQELPITIRDEQHNSRRGQQQQQQQQQHHKEDERQHSVQYQDYYEAESHASGWRMKQNAMWRLWTRFLARGRRGKFSVIGNAGGSADSFPVEAATSTSTSTSTGRLKRPLGVANKLGPLDSLKQTATSTPTSGHEASLEPQGGGMEELEASGLPFSGGTSVVLDTDVIHGSSSSSSSRNGTEANSNKFPPLEKVTKTITHL